MRSTRGWIVLVLYFVGWGLAGGQAQAQVAAPAAEAAAPTAGASGAGAPFQIRQMAYIKASNPNSNDNFGDGGNLPGHAGNSVALSGDGNILAIGAHQESSASKGINGNQNDTSIYAAGAVYVYKRSGGSWVQTAYIKASNPQQGANFGTVVALNADGTTMAVSAYFE